MPDITMNIDDTLELDTVIREDISAKGPVEVTDGTDYNMNGIQTKTAIFDPQSSGDYNIKVNGQELSIKVNDSTTIPDSVLLEDYADNKFASSRDNYTKTSWDKYTPPTSSDGSLESLDTRPDWDGRTSNISVSNGVLTLSNPNTGLYTDDYYEPYRYYRLEAALDNTSGDDVIMIFFAEDASTVDGGANYGPPNNGYQIRFGSDGNLDIRVRSGGNTSKTYSTTYGWSGDTNFHFWDVLWEKDGSMTVYFDGSSILTATDTSYTDSNIKSSSGYGISNNGNSETLDVNRFEVY